MARKTEQVWTHAEIVAMLGVKAAERLMAHRLPVVRLPFTLDQGQRISKLVQDDVRDFAEWKGLEEPVFAFVASDNRRWARLGHWVDGGVEQILSNGAVASPRVKRTRRPITDPEVLAKRSEAMAKARAARAERLAAARMAVDEAATA